tara:strand:+ start:450 stop:698 length:249 start_codon:yes stop_codon:yes gene_type:complete
MHMHMQVRAVAEQAARARSELGSELGKSGGLLTKPLLLLKLRVDGYATLGSDVSWASIHPQQQELVYPPCTYLEVPPATYHH